MKFLLGPVRHEKISFVKYMTFFSDVVKECRKIFKMTVIKCVFTHTGFGQKEYVIPFKKIRIELIRLGEFDFIDFDFLCK